MTDITYFWASPDTDTSNKVLEDRVWNIMDGRAAGGDVDGYERATVLECCTSLKDAQKSIRDFARDSTIWEVSWYKDGACVSLMVQGNSLR